MFEINGKYATAKCYATNIEQEAIDQIQSMCDMVFTEGQNIAIMPDAHAGKGCTIGTTMTVKDKVCPNIVGVDLNCGVLTVDLGVDHIDFKKLDEICHIIPHGRDVWDGRKKNFDLTQLACYRYLNDVKRIKKSIGTLGGGNHFLEISRSETGKLYLVIHSGSRNLGKQVAEYYQNIAIQLHSGFEDLFKARQTIIDTYKAEGRRTEIQGALADLNRNFKQHKCEVPKDLAFLYGQWFDDYIGDVRIIKDFANLNRETMAEVICDYLKITPVSMFHTIHNYIDVDEMILRKGAISAKKDELVIIPLNMRDGSVIAKGRGNEGWNNSGPHGAGRVMSRTKARETLSLEKFQNDMKDVYTTTVNESTIDEAPDAYKSKEDIIGPISESVDVIEIMKPLYNFKAAK